MPDIDKYCWWPRVGWVELPKDLALDLDLNVNKEWEGFCVRWLGWSVGCAVRERTVGGGKSGGGDS